MCTDYEGPKPAQKAEIERKLRQEIFGYVPRSVLNPNRHPLEQDFEVFGATIILDRNSQVRLHKPMKPAAVKKTNRARAHARAVAE